MTDEVMHECCILSSDLNLTKVIDTYPAVKAADIQLKAMRKEETDVHTEKRHSGYPKKQSFNYSLKNKKSPQPDFQKC